MFEENQKLIDDAKELETLRADKAALIAELQAIRQERENEINDDALETECKEIAQSAFDEITGLHENESPEDLRDEFDTHIHETIDGHQWLMYPAKTHQLCANCDMSSGEEYLADVGAGDSPDYDKFAQVLAYGEMKARAMSALDDLIEEWNDEHEGDEDEDDEDEESDEGEENEAPVGVRDRHGSWVGLPGWNAPAPTSEAPAPTDALAMTAEERAELDAGNAADVADWEASDKSTEADK